MTAAEFIDAYWPYIAIAVVAVLIVVWLANRKTSVIREGLAKDVLDEGAERARRNQALINAAPAEPPPQPTVATVRIDGDDLTRIKGLGPKIATLLHEMGITRFAQIADWEEADIDRIDAQLGRFEGRIRRDSWVEQAKFLSQGDESGFSAKFGQNG